MSNTGYYAGHTTTQVPLSSDLRSNPCFKVAKTCDCETNFPEGKKREGARVECKNARGGEHRLEKRKVQNRIFIW